MGTSEWYAVEAEDQMDYREDNETWSMGGFAEDEMRQLVKLRRDYNERVRLQALAEQRRLEFLHWLVVTGKLTEHVAQY
jgi:hypothetical protein